ncbi:TadE/TadG family type IV pilus assembly protein [Noviherbaspirillum aerium]|uniref:TadE/TadG family type IV pilus assembly protein n=1 Tax=Noviherbaspirillum aerium TaxID=2588497 RepID=UPI00124D4AC4|nr:TadE family protein [Noviherbaspirillum aerium]
MQAAFRNRYKRRQRGASAVEFAIVAPLVFFLLFAVIDLCVMFWVNLTMQYAVREGARYAVTGLSDLGPQGNPQRHLAVIEKIKDSSMGLYDRISPRINGVNYAGNDSQYHAGMFGAPGQVFVLRLEGAWPLMSPVVQPFFDDGIYRFTVAATMRNEEFR